jgi:hypothetical protein
MPLSRNFLNEFGPIRTSLGFLLFGKQGRIFFFFWTLLFGVPKVTEFVVLFKN